MLPSLVEKEKGTWISGHGYLLVGETESRHAKQVVNSTRSLNQLESLRVQKSEQSSYTKLRLSHLLATLFENDCDRRIYYSLRFCL